MDGIKSLGLSGKNLSSAGSLDSITRKMPTTQGTKTHQAAEQFESMLLHQMFNSMSQNVPSDTLLGGEREQEYYKDMYNEAMAESIAKGKSLGIKDIIERELTKNQGKALKTKSEP